jgi:hypothetical protein
MKLGPNYADQKDTFLPFIYFSLSSRSFNCTSCTAEHKTKSVPCYQVKFSSISVFYPSTWTDRRKTTTNRSLQPSLGLSTHTVPFGVRNTSYNRLYLQQNTENKIPAPDGNRTCGPGVRTWASTESVPPTQLQLLHDKTKAKTMIKAVRNGTRKENFTSYVITSWRKNNVFKNIKWYTWRKVRGTSRFAPHFSSQHTNVRGYNASRYYILGQDKWNTRISLEITLMWDNNTATVS